MMSYCRRIDDYSLRVYHGVNGSVYIGLLDDEDDHLYAITRNGLIDTVSKAAEKFKILRQPDNIEDD